MLTHSVLIPIRWLWALLQCPTEYRQMFWRETREGGMSRAIAFSESRYRAKLPKK